MGNDTTVSDCSPRYLDGLVDMAIRIPVLAASLVVLLFNIVSLVAMNRTSHTPKTARFLSSALLVFDVVTLSMYTVRKFIRNGRYNLHIQMLAICWCFLAYVDITIMSLERLLVFQWPNFYLRRFSFSKFRVMCLCFWTVYFLFYAFYVVVCFTLHCEEKDLRGCFDPMVYNYIKVTFPTFAIVSCFSLMKIILLIRHHTKGTTLPSYKSTVIVFLCCFNYVAAAIFYAVIMLVTVQDNFMRRILLDILMVTNGFLDSCVYVWWYKECRLEMLKLLSKVFPSFEKKIEKMRIEVFDIMTYVSKTAE